MKEQLTKNLIILCTILFGFQIINAQTVFWEEDFSSIMGLPTGWTTVDTTGGAGEWIWCDTPIEASSCIVGWDLFSDQHEGGFFSSTAENGFVLMDSDGLGNVSPNHVVQLTTTSIDCSGQPEVWVKFESLIGIFENPTPNNVFLRVSLNGTDWTGFDLFDISIATRWSDNPEFSFIDISSVAAGEATVYLQFSWTGNFEYYWLIDDMQLYDADPTALFIVANDMRVNENFYAIAPNAMWPASQIECFGFLADVENVGSAPQTGVNLNVMIEENGNAVYSEDLFYGDMPVDSLAENQLFEGCFTPDATPGNVYNGTYTITADSVDLAPENNIRQFNFMVTDTIFSKEMGATNSIQPADSNWEGVDEGHSWTMGNCYYIVNGDGYFARTISFGLGNADDPGIATRLISLNLWEWEEDTNLDGNADVDERTKIASNIYEIQGTETLEDVITLPLLTFPTFELAPIPLKDTTRYIAMIEYVTIDQINLYFSGSIDFDYGAQVYHSENLVPPAARQAEMIAINGDLETEAFDNGGFASGIVPVCRLSIGDQPLSVGTKDILSDNNILFLSPNPTCDKINLSLDLTEIHKKAKVKILDVSGKVLLERKYEGIQKETFTYDISNYSNGTYLLHFITESGVRTERFIVQH